MKVPDLKLFEILLWFMRERAPFKKSEFSGEEGRGPGRGEGPAVGLERDESKEQNLCTEVTFFYLTPFNTQRSS